MQKKAALTPQEERALTLFKTALQKICGKEGWEIRLFGSRARFEGDEDSDLDILVLLQSYDEKTKVKIWDVAYSIFTDTEILISPHVLSYERYENLKNRERLIAQEIERDGVVL